MASPNSLPKLSVVGLGKLGAPAAAVFASKGYSVIGYDVNQRSVETINAGFAPVQESGLEELIQQNTERFTATSDLRKAVLSSDVSFIIVPTPSKADGAFSNKYVLDAVTKIGKALREKETWHLVVICCTVMPGATETAIKPCLEKSSGRVVGENVGLCYNPEFIALGSVINDMLNPDIVLIGESDKRSGDFLEKIYKRSCDSKPAIKRMNFINAELTKISINTYVTTKISYANMIADMCDNLSGADCNVVTDAIGGDSRIGHKYLKGATGYGGPCFPRDNVAFAALAKKIRAKAGLAIATDKINKHQPQRLIKLLKRVAPKAKKIAIIGLSYKPDTPVIEESQGVKLALLLQKNNCKVTVYDRLADQAAKNVIPKKIKIAASLDHAVTDQDAILIMVPDPAYARFDWSSQMKAKKPVAIIDCWRILKNTTLTPNVTLVFPGKHVKITR